MGLLQVKSHVLPGYIINSLELKVLVDLGEKRKEGLRAYLFYQGDYRLCFYIGEEDILAKGIICS